MIWIAVLFAAIVLGAIVVFNRMVALRRLTENAWSDVDVFLRQRAELIPNLMEVVRGVAAHEQTTLVGVAEARSRALAAPSLNERGTAESELSRKVAQVVAIGEAAPTLRASDHFLRLQEELTKAERHIADSRRYYNACVRDFNVMIESFPQSLVAQTAGFRPKEFFELDTLGERQAPSVRGL
ncbi:MAG: LemA family protein [Fimbriimonas sp.]